MNDKDNETDPIISAIRKEYQRIQSAKLTKKEIEYATNPDSEAAAVGVGGKVTLFYEGGNLVKVLDEGSEDHGVWKEEYYYKNGKFFFYYNNNSYGGAMAPTANKYQSRIYINDGKVYKEIISGDRKSLDEFEKKRILEKARDFYKVRTAKDIANLYD